MKIREFQNMIAEALNGDETLVQGGCKAFSEDALEIVSAVEAQLAQAGGVAIVVTTPEFHRNGCASDGIPSEAKVAIRCIEVVATNRDCAGHLTALDAAEEVAHALTDIVQFDGISQFSDEKSGTVTATASFNASILLT